MKPYKGFISISTYLIREERWNCYRHSFEPVTRPEQYVSEYEQMWKWMVEFLSQFKGRGMKIDRVNSSRVAKSMIF